MTIKRETVIRWLRAWKTAVEEDYMFPCCESAVINEIDMMVEAINNGAP